MCRASDLSLYHLTLSSLEGIECLVNTRQLTLEWASKIDDLGPVFRLHQLTSLSIFDFPKLRHLDGIASLAEPLAAYFDTNLKCEACHGPRFMFVGRRMPVLCRSCDSVQFARRVAEFERLVHDA